MIDYDGDTIWVGADEYKSTEALWELIMAKNPSKKLYFLPKDIENYKEILSNSNVIFVDNNPNNRPKSSGGKKYKDFISDIYYDIKEKRKAKEAKEGEKATGKGITIIPSNPNSLLERLDLLMASKKAGNTGVRNELVSICDELKRQRVLNSKSYENLMSIL